MLSFCRGSILTKYDRIYGSFESGEMQEIVQSTAYAPLRQRLSEADLKRAYRRLLKQPEVKIPVDSYVLYSTLPDSKYGFLLHFYYTLSSLLLKMDKRVEMFAASIGLHH